jgi:hypothetical protein
MKKKGDTVELKTNDVLHGESFSQERFLYSLRAWIQSLKLRK